MSLFPDWRGDALWKCFISKIKFKKLNEFRFVAVGRERGFLEKIAIHKLEKLQRLNKTELNSDMFIDWRKLMEMLCFYIEINPKLVITKRHSDVGDQDDDGWTDEEAIDARVESNGVVRDGERNQGEKDV